jgi:predicted enzyme related to lactoylglutathione lyase
MPDTTPSPSIGLVLDCSAPERLAEFWALALGYGNLGTFGSYVALVPHGRPGPKLLLQRVDEPKSVKNRMHFDIEVPDIHAEAARLVALGATRVSEQPLTEHGTSWLLMTDPEGNEFCVCDAGQPQR